MRFSLASGVRNDLLQILVDDLNTPNVLSNPLAVSLWFGVTVFSPHAGTDRDSYTVPAGKGAVVPSFSSSFIRITSATTATLMTINAEFRPSGGSFVNLGRHTAIMEGTDDVNNRDSVLGLVMSVGDTIKLSSSDSSTGGTMAMTGSLPIIQYDL